MAVKFDDKVMLMHVMKKERSTYLYVQMIKPKTCLKHDLWVLDLIPNAKPNYYTSFENLPVCNITQIIADLVNNRKICFDDKMTGSYFFNFIAQSMNNKNKLFVG